jgi:hypothetical protein
VNKQSKQKQPTNKNKQANKQKQKPKAKSQRANLILIIIQAHLCLVGRTCASGRALNQWQNIESQNHSIT